MRLLDIDLDFFLDDICHGNEFGRRLKDGEYNPWSKYDVCNYLESKCGLSNRKKTLGRIVTRHHEAFWFWRELHLKNKLSIPFELTHIDAHSDLGQDGSWDFIIGHLLHKSIRDRIYPEKIIYHKLNPDIYNLNEGNFLICAIACGWISQIRFITHPRWSPDFERIHFKNMDEKIGHNNRNIGYIQLKKYPPKQEYYDIVSGKVLPEEVEPEVKLEIIHCKNFFNQEPFSFVSLSCSPEYTPPKSDALINTLKSYITII